MNPTQTCAYCGTEFTPAVRFKQKYCSKSCKTLYCQHKGSRQEYEARKAELQGGIQKADAPTPQAKRFFRMFLRDYESGMHKPQALQSGSLGEKIEATLAQNVSAQERTWLLEIQTTFNEMSQFKPKNKDFQFLLNTKVREAIEAYLKDDN